MLDLAGHIYFFAAAFFLFGLVFGSFLNVCIYRMPREISVVSPRSACPACEAPIAGYDNIPVLSWLILRGKCRNCKAPISPRYAMVELLTGMAFMMAFFAAMGLLPGTVVIPDLWCDIVGGPLIAALKLCVLCFLLIGLIFTDAETQLLPDLLTKPGIVLGLAFSLAVPLEGPAHYLPFVIHNCRILSLVNSLAGSILGAAFILGAALLYEAIRGAEGMGRGDVKLMALIGGFVGVELTLLVLLLGSVIGSLFGMLLIFGVWLKRLARRRRRIPSEPAKVARARAWQSARLIPRYFPIPFGVFLGIGALIAAFWGHALIDWYKNISGLNHLHAALFNIFLSF
ncbi:MAG TPA: prepilin peptidase [Candidatus Angelobacter sp.]|nr:prepilin peptidase [Candidatus Angelobacter sp.]